MEDNAVPRECGSFVAGDTIHGYIVEISLGAGSIGAVYLVRHMVLGTRFAMKILNRDVAEGNVQYVKRFLREAILACRIRHPNLVAVHDAGYDDKLGVYYIVMDYIQGRTLRQVIALNGSLSEDDAVRVVSHVARALDAGQRFGMVHRDIKPGNIMLTDDGAVKLIDLGIAKVSEGIDSLRTMGNTVFGTPAYISPEQAMDSGAVDVRSDIYSLGIVFFEMLCGRSPYEGMGFKQIVWKLLSSDPIPDVRTFNPAVSPKLSAVMLRMCAKNPNDRISSPAALLEVFARLGYSVQDAAESARTNLSANGAALPGGDQNGVYLGQTRDGAVEDFLFRLKRKLLLKWIGICLSLALVACGIIWVIILFFVG